MPGIDRAAGAGVDELPVRAHRLEDGPELGVHEITPQLVDRPVDLCVEHRIGGHLPDHLRHVDQHHRDRVPARRDQRFGLQKTRRGEHPQRIAEHVEGLCGIGAIARSRGVFGHGDCGETLREDVAPLLDGCALGGHREKQVSVGVDAVAFEEVQRALRRREPLGIPPGMAGRRRIRNGPGTRPIWWCPSAFRRGRRRCRSRRVRGRGRASSRTAGCRPSDRPHSVSGSRPGIFVVRLSWYEFGFGVLPPGAPRAGCAAEADGRYLCIYCSFMQRMLAPT